MVLRLTRTGRAQRRNQQGMDCDDAGQHTEALAHYREAARLDPAWAVPWFNIGLVHKYRGEWLDCLVANQEALKREAAHEGAIWNLGIAATAVSDWATAREAWRRYGINLPEGEGPIAGMSDPTPIRIDPQGEAEVIWTDRIDPARAVIRSVPLPQSRRRYGDVVLHDGAPNGYRLLGDREVAVFDELQLLQPSGYGTFEVFVEGVSVEDLDGLDTLAQALDVHMENWTANVRTLCRACSEGRPFGEGQHDHPPIEAAGCFRLGFAASSESMVVEVLSTWAGPRGLTAYRDLTCLLPPMDGIQ